jgi:hypothetical protein
MNELFALRFDIEVATLAVNIKLLPASAAQFLFLRQYDIWTDLSGSNSVDGFYGGDVFAASCRRILA